MHFYPRVLTATVVTSGHLFDMSCIACVTKVLHEPDDYMVQLSQACDGSNPPVCSTAQHKDRGPCTSGSSVNARHRVSAKLQTRICTLTCYNGDVVLMFLLARRCSGSNAVTTTIIIIITLATLLVARLKPNINVTAPVHDVTCVPSRQKACFGIVIATFIAFCCSNKLTSADNPAAC